MALDKDRSQEETRVRERARSGVGWMRGTQAESGREGGGERTRVGRSGLRLHPPTPPSPRRFGGSILRAPPPPPRRSLLLAPPLHRGGPFSWPRLFKSRRGHFGHAPRPQHALVVPPLSRRHCSRLRPRTQQLLGQDLVLTPLPTCPFSVPALSPPTSPPRSCRSRRRLSFCRACRW